MRVRLIAATLFLLVTDTVFHTFPRLLKYSTSFCCTVTEGNVIDACRYFVVGI